MTAVGFNATIANFVTLMGDFGFKKTATNEIIVVALNAGASLTAGSMSVGVSGATLGLLIKQDNTLALQASGALNLNLGSSFGSLSADSVVVAYNNTGADIDMTATVGSLSAPIKVTDNTIAVAVLGFKAPSLTS